MKYRAVLKKKKKTNSRKMNIHFIEKEMEKFKM